MFEFNFTIDDIDKCLKETEKPLRKIVNQVMTNKLGPNWMDKIESKLPDIKLNAESTRSEERERFPNQKISDNLLDYTYLVDLGNIILKYWDYFSAIFPPKNITEHYLRTIGIYRNPSAHARESFLQHQLHLCLGMCGELVLYIHRWNIGFRHRIRGFYCEFGFSVYPGDSNDDDMESTATQLGTEWIKKVEGLSDKAVEEHESGIFNTRDKLVRFSEGNVTLGYPHTQQQFDGKYFYKCTVQSYFSTVEVINMVVKEAKHPYYSIQFLLLDELDVTNIVSLIKFKTDKKPSSTSSTGVGQTQRLGRAEYIIVDNETEPLSTLIGEQKLGNFKRVRVSISINGLKDAASTVGITLEGNSNESFFYAHILLNPTYVLSALIGDIPPNEIPRRVNQSLEIKYEIVSSISDNNSGEN